MTCVQHFVSISGGKDSTAVACLAIERMERRPDFRPRFLFADTGNEHELTIEHVAYLGDALGIEIETVRADFAHLFPARRERIARDWPNELRRKMHTRAAIRNVVEWTKTGRGGRQFSLLSAIEDEEGPALCKSRYGLCE